ncbi:MAG: hypothetical protein WBE13_15855 [Candidatus Acidiferrum sp.]
MKKTTLVIPLLFWLGPTVYSQEQTPQLLLHAAQCLEAKKFLPSSRATKLTFGYSLDERSYPGDRVIYLVNYAAPARSNGLVFAIFLTEHHGHQAFNIQNNASFVLSKDDPSGVSFVNPPLGGTWTQEHLASAIKEIEKQPRFALSVKDLFVAKPSLVCESYTDPQPKKGEK